MGQEELRIDILVLCDFVLGVFLAVFAFAISSVCGLMLATVYCVGTMHGALNEARGARMVMEEGRDVPAGFGYVHLRDETLVIWFLRGFRRVSLMQ